MAGPGGHSANPSRIWSEPPLARIMRIFTLPWVLPESVPFQSWELLSGMGPGEMGQMILVRLVNRERVLSDAF